MFGRCFIFFQNTRGEDEGRGGEGSEKEQKCIHQITFDTINFLLDERQYNFTLWRAPEDLSFFSSSFAHRALNQIDKNCSRFSAKFMSAILLPLEITSIQRYFSILARHSHNIERSDLRLGDKVFQLRPTKVQTEKTSGYSFILTIRNHQNCPTPIIIKLPSQIMSSPKYALTPYFVFPKQAC